MTLSIPSQRPDIRNEIEADKINEAVQRVTQAMGAGHGKMIAAAYKGSASQSASLSIGLDDDLQGETTVSLADIDLAVKDPAFEKILSAL